MRVLLLALLACFAAFPAGCGEYDAGENGVRVDIHEVWDATEGMYAEGSYSYIRVERLDGDELLEEQFEQEEILHLRLDPGSYRFVSFQRPCDGSCDSLDPPTDECQRVIPVEKAEPGRGISIEVRVIPGERCRFAKIGLLAEID